jgi:hypothetical protein
VTIVAVATIAAADDYCALAFVFIVRIVPPTRLFARYSAAVTEA